MAKKLGVLLGVSVLLATATATAAPAVHPMAQPNGCGAFVQDATDQKKGNQILAFVEPDSSTSEEKGSLKIDLGQGVETLTLKSRSEDAPEKVGDKLISVYENKNAHIDLNETSLGLCGDAPQFAKSESCEYVAFSGTMRVKTPQGKITYKVLVHDGC